jgi:hypothetical protein
MNQGAAMALPTRRKHSDHPVVDEQPVQFVTPEEGAAIFDRQARALVGLSGEEFLRRWDAGEFRDTADTPGHLHVMRLVASMPFSLSN